MTTPSKRLDCKELQTKILVIIKDDHQPSCPIDCFVSAYLWDPLTKDSLGPRSKQAAGLSSHTDKTVENKGTGNKGRGMGWGEVKGMEYNYWAGREGLKTVRDFLNAI